MADWLAPHWAPLLAPWSLTLKISQMLMIPWVPLHRPLSLSLRIQGHTMLSVPPFSCLHFPIPFSNPGDPAICWLSPPRELASISHLHLKHPPGTQFSSFLFQKPEIHSSSFFHPSANIHTSKISLRPSTSSQCSWYPLHSDYCSPSDHGSLLRIASASTPSCKQLHANLQSLYLLPPLSYCLSSYTRCKATF